MQLTIRNGCFTTTSGTKTLSLPTISILLTECHTIIMVSVLRIWCFIEPDTLVDVFLPSHRFVSRKCIGIIRSYSHLVSSGSERLKEQRYNVSLSTKSETILAQVPYDRKNRMN